MPRFRFDKQPRPHGRKWRVRVYDAEGGSRSESFATREEAEEFIRALAAKSDLEAAWERAHDLQRQADDARAFALSLESRALTVEEALGKYELALRERRLREISITGRIRMIRIFCRDIIDTPMSAVTDQQAQAIYMARTQMQVRRHGEMQPIADATHIKDLELARDLWRHAREQKWTHCNPWDAVKPIGRASRGKEQLTLAEARKLHGVMLVALRGETLRGVSLAHLRWRALGAGLALYVMMRASEITDRMTVRLVSVDGAFIELRRTKTRKGDRGLHVPAFLAVALAEARRDAEARGGPDARILPHKRDWVLRQAHHFCDMAGVPRVCAHALRGTMSSVLAAHGVSIPDVAGMLGHADDTRTTTDSYVEPSVVQAAATERGLRVLDGGKKR